MPLAGLAETVRPEPLDEVRRGRVAGRGPDVRHAAEHAEQRERLREPRIERAGRRGQRTLAIRFQNGSGSRGSCRT